MKAEELMALKNVQVIRDYLFINAEVANFTSLSFLKNLRTIKGQHLIQKYVTILTDIRC